MKNSQIKNRRNSIKKGDIFSVGGNFIACGDARDPELVQRLVNLAEGKVSLIACDPPFGVMAVENKEGFVKLKVNKKIQNDDIVSEEKYAKFTQDWLSPIVPYLAHKNSAYIFNSDKMLFALRKGMESTGFTFSQLLVWVKNHSVLGRKDYLMQHELIAFGWHGVHRFAKSQDKSLILYPKPNKSALHPTMKPVGLMRRLILNSTDIGNIVYDPFLGSGSTAAACCQTKRKCIGIEIDPEYCLRSLSCQMRHSVYLCELLGCLHVQAKVRTFVVVVLQELVNLLLDSGNIFWLVLRVPNTLFTQNAIKSFNESLFVLLVRFGGSD